MDLGQANTQGFSCTGCKLIMSQTRAPLQRQDFTDEEKDKMANLLNKKGEHKETRRVILKLLEEVECKIDEVESEYGAIQNRHNPILTLPNEVTCLIFESAQLPMIVGDKVNHYLMEVVVSHVCRHWRTVSLGYPKLWSKIFHKHDLTAVTLARFEAYMKRSASLPLRLWFDFRAKHYGPLNNQLFDMAIDHARRWQHFTLHSTQNRDLLGCLSRLQNVSAPMLEFLVLSLDPNFDNDEDDNNAPRITNLDASIFKSGAPKLTYFFMDDRTLFHAIPPLSNMTTLWLETRGRDGIPRFSTQAFIDLLSIPSLEHVSFDGGHERADVARRIEMPNLKRFYFSDFTAMWSFLPNIRAPRLETLLVYNCQFDKTTPDATLLDKSYCFPALKKLWIVDSELIPKMASHLIKLTSQATEVMISHDVLLDSLLITIVDDLDRKKIWPHLETLICNIEGCTEIDPYLAFAKSRPKKSFKLKLHPYLLSHWEDTAANRLRTLQKACMVEAMDEKEWIEQERFWPKDTEFSPSSEEDDNPCYVCSNY